MSQSRWKYWIEDGTAHINEENMPAPHKIEAQLVTPLKISICPRMNPDYNEFRTEIRRVTGKDQIIVHKKDNPGEGGVNRE